MAADPRDISSSDQPSSNIQAESVSAVYHALGTSPTGLSVSEAALRLSRCGPNSISEIKGKPLYLKFLANFTHVMAILLWVGGVVGFIAQMPQLGIAIWTVNLINGCFSFWQEYRADKATEALRKLLPVQARVMRDGTEMLIPAEQLVPGDLMVLAEGDHISADARLVYESELRTDQSTLSGESHPVRKTAEAVLQSGLGQTELPNLVFAGTCVASGTGRAVVFATGMHTQFGKIANLTQQIGEELSPLQKEIGRVTRVVTIMACSIGVIFFMLATFVVGVTVSHSFIFAMGMIVAFVPEGLLPTVTLSLAMGVQRMARRNALVKRLSSVETLGCTTVICTDKTGTLTENEMTVTNIWLGGRSLKVTGVGYAADGEIQEEGSRVEVLPGDDLHNLLLAGGLCNDARVAPAGNGSGGWKVLGDPTEASLLVVAAKAGLDLAAEAERQPRLREIPFESRRKMMSTVHRGTETGDKGQGNTTDITVNGQRSADNVVFVKGAPGEVLARCSFMLRNGRELPFDDAMRADVMSANDDYARNGLRVLAVARRRLDHDFLDFSADKVEQGLTLLGVMAMMDPPRAEVSEAVAKCRSAGIRIMMITGDYGLTAESIARRIGIIGSGRPLIISGTELDGLDDCALKEELAKDVIFARAAPEHKLRVVNALRGMGQVVAVTGDGVNDAPALKQADIGVAMGIAGTDVAKEAADMILTDDNFASIVNAIEEGRTVYANIRKFATYIFTSNMPEAWPFILQIMFNVPLALTVMQILAIDLGTDMVPALALGTEKPEPGIMDKPPRSVKDRLIDKALLLRAMVWQGTLQTLLCFSGFFLLYWMYGYRNLLHLPRPDLLPYTERLLTVDGQVYVLATSIFLAGVVTTQIGNAYACRTDRVSVFSIGFFSNRMLLVGFAVELAIVCLLIYVPPFQGIFELGALPLEFWGMLFCYPPVMFLAEEGRKAYLRKKLLRRPT